MPWCVCVCVYIYIFPNEMYLEIVSLLALVVDHFLLVYVLTIHSLMACFGGQMFSMHARINGYILLLV